MANTTFSGPVRSENGFIGATKNATTGVFTNVFAIGSTGAYTGTKLVAQGTADVIVASTAGTTEVQFSQPNNSIITSIDIVCTSAPTVASGDIGFKVGTATGGAQLVAAITDQILDGGTTVPAGAGYNLTLINTTGSDASPAASPAANVSGAARNIFLQITNTTNASANGNFRFIINIQQF
tara:strand:- start:170 stop:712 length:543 start_codon:yes stop_codon:yes gene_type:complete